MSCDQASASSSLDFEDVQITDFLDILEVDSDKTTIASSNSFLLQAEKYGLISDGKNGIRKRTIIAPMYCADMLEKEFIDIFNLHSTLTMFWLCDANATMQVLTQGNMFYNVFTQNKDYYIGGCKILYGNQTYGPNIIHYIETPLSRIRFEKMNIFFLPLVLLGNTTVEFNIEKIIMNEPVSLKISFYDDETRKPVSKYLCHIDSSEAQHTILLRIPDVTKLCTVNLWIQIISVTNGMNLMSWLRPHKMIIYQNTKSYQAPELIDFIPKTCSKNQQIWIHGKNFDPKVVRVSIGDKCAVKLFASETLIKCIVPTQSKKDNEGNSCLAYVLQVANGSVFVTAPKKIQYV